MPKVMNSEFTNETPEAYKERSRLGVEAGEGNTCNPSIRIPTWEQAPNEKWITQKYCNAYITIGHDRPSHLWSGYGANAGTECSTIDICVGSASSLRVLEKGGKKSFGKQKVIGKIFAADASRIYMSQQTDIDKNFGLPKGKSPDSVGAAAIAVKSDHVRVIGRTSIKFYIGRGAFEDTGITGEKTSRGVANQQAGCIEFIASNPDNLQPLVKGQNLIECLSNIYDHIARINQLLLQYDKGLLTVRGAAILNFHPSTPVVSFPDPINIITQLLNLPGEISNVYNNVVSTPGAEIDKNNYLGLTDDHGGGAFGAKNEKGSLKGKKYILSHNVFTT